MINNSAPRKKAEEVNGTLVVWTAQSSPTSYTLQVGTLEPIPVGNWEEAGTEWTRLGQNDYPILLVINFRNLDCYEKVGQATHMMQALANLRKSDIHYRVGTSKIHIVRAQNQKLAY